MVQKGNLWKVIDVINWGRQFLNEKAIDSPRLTIELLLCKVLSCSRIDLYSGFERYLSDSELELLKSFIKRRLKHEPLQYILGSTGFMGLEIAVMPGVLIPRPETEQLVSLAVETCRSAPPATILDIGTGSGCIALALAQAFPEAVVCGADLSPKAVETAAANARTNGVANVEFVVADILKSGAPESYIYNKRYELVVSNPPYIDKEEHDRLDPEVREYEPEEALTDKSDGLTFYRRFAEIFPGILTENGRFFLEIAYGQSESVEAIFRNKGFGVVTARDFSGIPRIVTNCTG